LFGLLWVHFGLFSCRVMKGLPEGQMSLREIPSRGFGGTNP